jgi:hypothetical protein
VGNKRGKKEQNEQKKPFASFAPFCPFCFAMKVADFSNALTSTSRLDSATVSSIAQTLQANRSPLEAQGYRGVTFFMLPGGVYEV